MGIKTKKALLSRGMAEKTVLTVPEWEVKILQKVHDKGNVEDQKDDGVMDREFDADAEYGRLAAKYGADKDSKVLFVETVYGEPEKLESVIKKATVK